MNPLNANAVPGRVRLWRAGSGRIILFSTLFLLVAVVARSQTILVYDDALQNGFSDYSFGGGSNFSATTFVHSGTKSVSITGLNFNALSFEHAPGGVPASLSAAATPVLRFWVNGGASSGQQFHIGLQNAGVPVGSAAALDTFIAGGGFAAGVWRQVTVNLTQPPFNAVNFDRIDIQSDAGGGGAPTAYFDDMVLGQAVITPTGAMQIDQGVMVSGMVSDKFTWKDSLNRSRSAALALMILPGDPAGPGGSRGGALREYKFQLSNGQTRTAGVTTYGNAGYGGFGYITMHSITGYCPPDDSPLGFPYGGTFERVFQGRHHAILRFRQDYPRNCPAAGGSSTQYIPVTIEWLFATGHDNPLWAVTYNPDQTAAVPGQAPFATAGTYIDDSRAPYGELSIDGEGFFYPINGVSWGDGYKFKSTNAPGTALTLSSTFDYTALNSIPFVYEWVDAPLDVTNRGDATMGIVQTQTLAQQDAGGGRIPGYIDIRDYWGKTDADNVHSAGPNRIPNGDNWPYQANGNNLTAGSGNSNARLTWKAQYGFVGQAFYQMHNTLPDNANTAAGHPKKSYSTYVVLGQHSTVPQPVVDQVAQIESIQSLTLSTAGGVGLVVTSGPAGITRADNLTYAPAGYNHVYGALAFNAIGNALDANIAVGAGTLKKPLLIISNYTGAAPTVKLGGAAATADIDYYASTRTSPNELWITLNRDLTGATNHVEINTGAPPPPGANISVASKTVSGSFQPGGAVTYTVSFTNTGAGAQTDNPGDEFTDVLPASLTLTSASATSGTATVDIPARTVHWNGGIASGASVTLTINASVVPAATGTVSNQGTVFYDADGNGTNESSRLTDDPSTVAALDPTSFNLGQSFYLLAPCRLIDTRGGGALGPGEVRTVTATGRCAIPSGAVGLAVNVTVVNPGDIAFATLYPGPAGTVRPNASTINFRPGRTLANNARIALGPDGSLNIFNAGAVPLDVLMDIQGYFK